MGIATLNLGTFSFLAAIPILACVLFSMAGCGSAAPGNPWSI